MAVIHHTTLAPTKLQLLASWLPSRPWYGGTGEPELTKAGGFRLDDPQGEVGMEFMVITDGSGARPTTYLVPLTYRGAPLGGLDHALIGTAEHGVLGRRWIYDGCHDPVLVAQLPALVEGRVQAQDQNTSHKPDPEVTRSYTGAGLTITDPAPVTDDHEATELTASPGTALRLHRILRPAPDDMPLPPPQTTGHVAGSWHMPDGTRAHGLFLVVHPSPRP